MEHTPEHNFSASAVPFRNHTALLLGAALPYLQPAYRHPVELALKFLEFSETLRFYREFPFRQPPISFYPAAASVPNGADTFGIFGKIHTYILDLEGLLLSLSSVCTGDEKELIQMFLNLIRARNFYDTYGDLMKSGFSDAGSLSQLFSSLNEVPFPSAAAGESSAGIAESLSSMLSEEQKETLELLKSLFSEQS